MTHFEMAIEVRFMRVPIKWELRRPGDPIAIPTGKPKSFDLGANEVDGWDLRDRFLRLERSEQAAISFLNDVGVWDAYEHDGQAKGTGQSRLTGVIGSRLFIGYAMPVELAELWALQQSLKKDLVNRAALKAKWGSPPR